MKKRNLIYSTLLYTLFTTIAFCQIKNDSINALITNYKRTINTNPDSAFYFINKAIKFSKKSNNDFLVSTCVYHLGCYYFLMNDENKSIQNFNKAIHLAQKSNNFKTEALSFNQLSVIDMDNGNYNTSLKKLLQAKNITEQNNLIETQCFILNNLGTLFESQGDSINALNYYSKNLEVASKNNFKVNVLSSYVNIALLIKKKHKQKAIDYLLKAKKIANEIHNKNEEFTVLINLSYIYTSMLTQDSNAKSFRCLLEAKKIVEILKDSEKLFFVNFNLGNNFLKQKKYDQAIKYYNESLVISKNGIAKDQKQKLYCALGDVYKLTGNYQKALFFNEKYYALKDSLFTLEKNKSFDEIQTKYEVEKKNLKINLLTKEKLIEENRKNKIVYVGITFIIVLLLLLFIYSHRIKAQKIINHQEKELKRIQGLVEGQNLERNRMAKEIHDGIGGKLIGIKYDLDKVSSDKNEGEIRQISSRFSSVFEEVRSISHHLSSNYINENSLAYLLKELQDDINKRGEFELEISIFPYEKSKSLHTEIKHQLYRIIQELLNNITKHAKAKNASVSVVFLEDNLNLVVEDDGIGFQNNTNQGIGLMNIKERLQLLKGSIEIDQSSKSGCTIIINIPNT